MLRMCCVNNPAAYLQVAVAVAMRLLVVLPMWEMGMATPWTGLVPAKARRV